MSGHRLGKTSERLTEKPPRSKYSGAPLSLHQVCPKALTGTEHSELGPPGSGGSPTPRGMLSPPAMPNPTTVSSAILALPS